MSTSSEIVQRFKFHSRVWKPGESVSTFVAELHTLATSCNFGDTLDIMLRDRIMCGINHTATQKRLLAEPKFTFKQALEIARGFETAARNIKELKPSHVKEMTSSPEVHKIASTKKPKAKGTCFHYGKPGHYDSKCKVSKAVTCHQCRKVGHLRRLARVDVKPMEKNSVPDLVQSVVSWRRRRYPYCM